jgi:hypothetical protein
MHGHMNVKFTDMCTEHKVFVFVVSKTFVHVILIPINIQRFTSRKTYVSNDLPVLPVGF